ncbi:30S ribosomal protein S16 [Candidatus Peregrinibacteria bacterium]|nr:30S ribosomal protein S16 [Candidatus Peregrinibacteria bacterium]
MLRIRFTRTGRKNQPKFRIVVAEHSAPVKGAYLEILGHYLPIAKEKTLVLNKERVLYWISKGAQPSDSIASLFKRQGMDNMDQYIGRRDFQRKNKKAIKAEAGAKPDTAPKIEKTEKAAEPVKAG